MSESVDTTYRMGLRFTRSDAGRLRRTAELVRAFDSQAVGLLDKAHEAAISDGVLEVYCSDPSEAIDVADDFPKRWGLPRPAVEVLRSPN